MLRAILFDVDGVLLDSSAANAAFYRELYTQAGGTGSIEELLKVNHLAMADMLHRFFPEKSHEEIRELVKLGDTIDAGYELLSLAPGADTIIPNLARDHKLALVTNRTREGIEELWTLSGLQKYFSASAAYGDTERHKPDAEPVRFALSRLGVEPNKAVFIGDAQTDLQAGQAAGVPVIIIGPEHWPGALQTVPSFTDLPAALRSL